MRLQGHPSLLIRFDLGHLACLIPMYKCPATRSPLFLNPWRLSTAKLSSVQIADEQDRVRPGGTSRFRLLAICKRNPSSILLEADSRSVQRTPRHRDAGFAPRSAPLLAWFRCKELPESLSCHFASEFLPLHHRVVIVEAGINARPLHFLL